MRSIAKGQEPLSLKQYRSTPNASYNGYQDKDALRSSLVKEQRGLCCYCLSRIMATPSSMKIEHWHSQANHPSEQLVYSNLLGACRGNEGQSATDQHCDTRKASQDISRNPANPNHTINPLIHFKSDGRVFSPDPTFNDELDRVLNLNIAFLVNNRKSVLKKFLQAYDSEKPQVWSSTQIERMLNEWNGVSSNTELKPFCQVIVYYLRKRLARR